ncbi:IgA peptidase M64-domain-containing protein [Schizophyllum amplum]|uniref:IgA peptidase M64-domain-containing protein n=1 Tax=Schizophyllum amplum TaxID=97359 RepID=A0A550CKU4_9AGAR|nr:IgA peptidase M64-domain-containing protein [Auriculariopsis ampla]
MLVHNAYFLALCAWGLPTALAHQGRRAPKPYPVKGQHNPSAQRVFAARAQAPPLEIRGLSTSGDSANRVDMIFFADGYTEDEKNKFFDDAGWLSEEITANVTFNTVKPLLNFWAAFTPSNESGVGTNGTQLDTVYGLYRPGTELRGVYVGKEDIARAACDSLGDQCDHPVIIGNSDLYGGIGGDIVTITPSKANGASILRHESGHNIIGIGEEYDGIEDGGYFGRNTLLSLDDPIPWQAWLTEPTSNGSMPRVERAVMPLQNYAWTLLNTTKPWAQSFVSSGTFASYVLRISISGTPAASDLRVEIDGEDVGWTPHEGVGMDRYFYDVYSEEPLSGGTHEVSFTLLNASLEGSAQMCSVEIMEYGSEEHFHSEPGYYGLFPSYTDTNTTAYRPTNEDCVMRQVTTPNYCNVCLEGMWNNLLAEISLIDGVNETCSGSTKTVKVALVPLAQLRTDPIDAEESLTIAWKKDGAAIASAANQTSVALDGEDAVGVYTVAVWYETSEVRTMDDEAYFSANATYEVTTAC